MLTIQTYTGKVKGSSHGRCRFWLGIPYAQPPLGRLRFRHARPHKQWEGVRNATEHGSICSQAGLGKNGMDEDCLTLNIWVPDGGAKNKAVLFYIHGGSFMIGSGSESRYDGRKLAEANDVVVVNFNYRLGALGFMDFSYLGDEFDVNCGLSDIVAALSWVHLNIEAFGGDPDNITIIGQSAGAIAVSALTVMPAAKPFISKAIMMSGGPIWMHQPEQAQEIAQKYLDFCSIKSAEQLKQISARELASHQKEFVATGNTGEATFAITVDGQYMPTYPIPGVSQGAAQGIPMLVGATKDELSFASKKLLSKIMMVKDVALALLSIEKKSIRKKIMSAYEEHGTEAESMFITDYVFRMSSKWFAEVASKHTDVWMYSFDYATLALRITTLHAIHSSDIPFLFRNYGAGRTAFMFMLSPIKILIDRISKEIQKDFTTFAKTGTLDWPKCHGEYTPAKSYNKNFKIVPMVEPKVAEKYNNSQFKQNALEGRPMLPGAV